MIGKKTIVDQIEITRSGIVQVRIGFLILEDGVEIDCKWHRTLIEPGVAPEAQMGAVNDHLVEMGKLPVSSPDLDYIKKIVVAAAR